jgi:hypothetical protein
MSSYGIHVPSPDDINYHEAQQTQRVERAFKQIDAGAVLAVVDRVLLTEPDPKNHPLFPMVRWFLDQDQTPVDGGQLYDRYRQLVLDAINDCLNAVLARGED